MLPESIQRQSKMIDNIQIRLAEAGDAGSIASIYGPVVRESTMSFEELAPTTRELRDRIVSGLQTYPWLVANGPDVAGYAYAGSHRSRAAYRWSVEVSVYVREDQRQRGIAKRLYTSLFRILAAQRFHRAFAGIALPNAPSIALHRSLGFTEAGVFREVGFKFGKWRDTSWWQRALNESDPPGAEPIAMHSLEPSLLRKALT